MTTTDLRMEEGYAVPVEPDDVCPEDWRPVVLDPVRARLVELGGATVAEALTEASPLALPPLATTYGWFSHICGETDEALTIWFQPVGDLPAVRLVVADPFASGWPLTEELAVPSTTRHLVVLAPLGADAAGPRAHAQLVAICTTPIEDFGKGAKLVTVDAIGSGRLEVRGSLVDL